MLLTPGGGSARVLRGALHDNTWNAWREKTVHHFDRDQEGEKGNKNFSGKLPKTATSLRSSYRGDSTSPAEGPLQPELSDDPRTTSQQARTPGAPQAEGGQERAPATRLAEKKQAVFQRRLRLRES